jgi:hypothetical protein
MRRIFKLIWSGSKRVSKRGRNVLGWLSWGNYPIQAQERQVTNFRLLEHAIKIGQSITFSYLNRSKKESEAPRPQGGASRRGNFILIVSLGPAYRAGLAGHLPATEEFFPRNYLDGKK